MSADIDEIKSRLKIEEIISEYIKIKKAGSGFTALCPFHNEKSPSFHISPDRGIYKCFGCEESGDILEFVQKFEGVDFRTALKKLAEKAGVQLQEYTKNPEADKEKEKRIKKEKRLILLLLEITKFFQINLMNNEKVKDYLKKRGLDGKTVKKFKIGYALDQWNSAESYLLKKKFSKEEIFLVGLIKKNERGKVYDRFRNRIMFPIFDESGRPVAFSGRDFSDPETSKIQMAKYLNSPETLFFNKSNILFGFNFAKIEARKRKYFIIVEGQMDLIMSHKAGFENTVATSGTSLTEEHLKLLSRFSKNLVFAFDADNAGIEASFRGIKKALAMDFDIKILDIPMGKDPADIILDSKNKWIEIVKNSKNINDFYIKKILESDKNLKAKIQDMEEKILPFVAEIINPIEKGKYISKISTGFGIKEDFVLEALENVEEKNFLDKKKENKQVFIPVKNIDIFSKDTIIEKTKKKILKQLTAIYYWQKNLTKSEPWVEPKKILEVIEKNTSKEIFKKIIELKTNTKYIELLIFDIEMLYDKKEKHALIFDINEMADRLHQKFLEEKILFLNKKISLARDSEKKGILEEIQNLNKEKNAS